MPVPHMGKKNRNADLGRALAKRKERDQAAAGVRGRGQDGASGSDRHVVNDDGRPKLLSVLESNDLEELMLNATLANKDFAAERYAGPVAPQTVVVTPGVGSSKAAQELNRRRRMDLNRSELRVPRRPFWDKTTTPAELQEQEAREFLQWRRRIAELEEGLSTETDLGGILLTPFEKNLEVWRQLWRVVERSDIVVQIVDARNPVLYYCEDLRRYVTEDMNRNHVLLLNKSDLLSSNMISKWETYFNNIGVEVIFFSAFKASVSEQVHDARIFGARDLIERLQKSMRTAPVVRENQRLVAGMCGYPNVGKSSTINVLLDAMSRESEQETLHENSMTTNESNVHDMSSKKSIAETATGYAESERVVSDSESKGVAVKRVAVSATPGKTKHFQTLVLTDELLLCDCPGLVFPNFSVSKAELICAGVLPIDQMRSETLVPIELIARRIPASIFEGVYGIRFAQWRTDLMASGDARANASKTHVSATQLLETHARARGFMSDHGRPDISRSSRAVLKDYVSGRIKFAHAPPPNEEEEGESGVGADVFAKKGRLVIARREAAIQTQIANRSVETGNDQNEGEEKSAGNNTGKGRTRTRKGLERRDGKHADVVARVSQRKKHAHKQFTRVERSYDQNLL